MTTTRTFLFCALTILAASGCADDAAPAPEVLPAVAPKAAREHDPSEGALATVLAGGDFPFALAESAVWATLKEGCATEPPTGQSREQCMERVRAEAAGEGLRLTPLGADRVRYLSYVHEDGQEKVHIEREARVVPVEPGIVAFVDPEADLSQGLPEGAHVLMEVVDDDTLAMDKVPGRHPRTGEARLVFHRASR